MNIDTKYTASALVLVIMYIVASLLLTSCASYKNVSPKSVALVTLDRYYNIVKVFYVSETSTEYIYIVTTTADTVSIMVVEKKYPFKVTKKRAILKH